MAANDSKGDPKITEFIYEEALSPKATEDGKGNKVYIDEIDGGGHSTMKRNSDLMSHNRFGSQRIDESAISHRSSMIGGGVETQRLRRSNLFTATMIILTATLNVPNVSGYYSQAGWIAGTIAFIYGGGAAYYAGILLWDICMREPDALSYPRISEIVGGAWFRRITVFVQVTGYFIFGVGNMALIGSVFKTIFMAYPTCYWEFVFVGFAVSWVLSIPPSFSEGLGIALASLTGSMCILIIMFVNFGISGKVPDVNYTGQSVVDVLNGIAGFAFMFGGAALYPEVIREMKKPEEFPKGLTVMFIFLMIIMAVSGIPGFALFGDAADFNPFVMFKWNPSVTVGNVFYLISLVGLIFGGNQLVYLTVEIHCGVDPTTVWQPRKWGLPPVVFRIINRSIILGLMLLLAQLIPFISQLQSLVGALQIALLSFTFPFAMHWKLYRNEYNTWKTAAHAVLTLCGLFICVSGLYAACTSIAQQASQYGVFDLPCDYTV